MAQAGRTEAKTDRAAGQSQRSSLAPPCFPARLAGWQGTPAVRSQTFSVGMATGGRPARMASSCRRRLRLELSIPLESIPRSTARSPGLRPCSSCPLPMRPELAMRSPTFGSTALRYPAGVAEGCPALRPASRVTPRLNVLTSGQTGTPGHAFERKAWHRSSASHMEIVRTPLARAASEKPARPVNRSTWVRSFIPSFYS